MKNVNFKYLPTKSGVSCYLFDVLDSQEKMRMEAKAKLLETYKNRAASAAKSVQSNPTIQPGNS